MSSKNFFKEIFLALFLVLLFSSPGIAEAHCKWSHPHHCVTQTVDNFGQVVSNITAVTVNFFITAYNVTVNVVAVAWDMTVVVGTGGIACVAGVDCDVLLRDAGCRINDLTQDPRHLRCFEQGGILTIGEIAIDAPACLAAGAELTFYDAGPRSPDEKNSTVQIYRFTLPQTERYYPVGGLTDEQAQNAAVMNWMAGLDNQVGNGLISPYDFIKESSYFLAKGAAAAPLVEVPYNKVCGASGVCRIRDQALPKDKFFAYIAKTAADYALTIPKGAVYQLQGECPVGNSSYTTGGKIYCVDEAGQYNFNTYKLMYFFISDQGGRRAEARYEAPPGGYENSDGDWVPWFGEPKWFIIDANGKRIDAAIDASLLEDKETSEISGIKNNYGNYYFKFTEDFFFRRQGKFLSAKSGQPVTDTYIGSPFNLVNGNGIFGPFKPIAETACPPIPAPTVISQTCNAVTLESKESKPLNVLRRVKGDTGGFILAGQFDFSGGRIFTDANLQPHTNYEYALVPAAADAGTVVQNDQIIEAYTFCRPSCKILSESAAIPELGSADLKWQCASDTVPISCQVQSDDRKIGVKSGLNSAGSLKVSPSDDSRYILTCMNVDGSVTLTPFKVNILKPGIKEVKP
ncbi:MAG: hypothetical protein HYY86_02480 [Candidatus Harrisonbacteria bacterium]|nr:hypothetical protein [Candidatus Harrisonbacteria bacterium]